MTKILAGLLVVVSLVGVVGSATFALFSNSGTIAGLNVAAGNADILLGYTLLDSTHTSTYANDLDFTSFGDLFGPLYPGYTTTSDLTAKDLWVKNNSTAPIPLNITMKLTTAPSQGWIDLAYAVQILVKYDNGLGTGANTGWMSLPEWANSEISLTGGSIAQGGEHRYFIYVRVPVTYGQDDPGYSGPTGPVGNEIAGQTLSGSIFTVTGTQQ